ncbi:ribosome biogenesis factor YjgA [Roseateles sp. BYS180W]|uniref:Dual-action ribosomal maturation protein DarP n=1 Tax=Roseateles rivi TaxID=3299028 RepID=A0ABW7FZ45_9BURK
MQADHDTFDFDDDRPSKSQLKRDMNALQELGVELLDLPDSRLNALQLPDSLLDAIKMARKLRNTRGAQRRQMQLIGKLMRNIDAEPVRQAVAEFKLGRALDSVLLHEAEIWRERLVAADDALQQFLSAHPGVDMQHLRSLIRAARKDRAAEVSQRNGRSWRELFQFIKATLNATRGGDAALQDEVSTDDDDE